MKLANPGPNDAMWKVSNLEGSGWNTILPFGAPNGATIFSSKGGFWSRKMFEVSHLEVPNQKCLEILFVIKPSFLFTKFKGWEKLKELEVL